MQKSSKKLSKIPFSVFKARLLQTLLSHSHQICISISLLSKKQIDPAAAQTLLSSSSSFALSSISFTVLTPVVSLLSRLRWDWQANSNLSILNGKHPHQLQAHILTRPQTYKLHTQTHLIKPHTEENAHCSVSQLSSRHMHTSLWLTGPVHKLQLSLR